MDKNVIQIKFVGSCQIDISRETYVNGVERSLNCVYCPVDFSNESVAQCFNRFLEAWEKEMFVPRLENEDGYCYGEIGQLTNIIDIDGKQLHVGDCVLVYDVNSKTKDIKVVCENMKFRNSADGRKYEIMGYFGLKWQKGFNHKDYFIIKLSSFESAKHNEKVGTLKYVLKPNE